MPDTVEISLSRSSQEQKGSRMSRSEVADLRQQIELELTAMRRGLVGLAQGSARHDFIHARMSQIGACQDTLALQVGETQASQIVCTLYIKAMEQHTS